MTGPRPRATVMGLGLFGGGVAVARHLVAAGFAVTVTDLRDAATLAPSVAQLPKEHVRLALGRHDLADFTATDLVVVNPAVPPGNAFVAAAIAAGVRLDTEIGLAVRRCPARIVAVTGTAGKSTTASLLHACLGAWTAGSGRRALLKGNIGDPLLTETDLAADDVVALELSSFQLHWLRREGWRPHGAVVTNVTPNHLDWHGTFEAYLADKAGVLPGPDGFLVACADDAGARRIADGSVCPITWTSRLPLDTAPSVSWHGADLVERRAAGGHATLLTAADVHLLGAHSLWNVASAAAAARAAGVPAETIRAAVRGFRGLRHRLCPVGTYGGVLCVDDSKSTTPDATAQGLAAFSAPVWLLAGGYDKGLDPAPLVAAAARADLRAVVCFGATRDALAAALEGAGVATVVVETLDDAVAAVAPRLVRGDVLLLSPGHASWDQFRNYEARGAAFADAVRRLLVDSPS